MITKYDFKGFFTKFKKIIVSCGICAIAIAIIAVVATNSYSYDELTNNNDDVNTVNTPTISFIMPVANGEIIKDFSSTSLQFNSTLKQWEAHKAVDIKGADNANVLAVFDGEVASIETNYLNGTTIILKHNNTLKSVYSSLASETNVSVGDTVKKGDIIGKVSDSAKSESGDGQHLHFEVLLNNVKTDPNLYLTSLGK